MLRCDADVDFPINKINHVGGGAGTMLTDIISVTSNKCDKQQLIAVSLIQHWSRIQKLYQ